MKPSGYVWFVHYRQLLGLKYDHAAHFIVAPIDFELYEVKEEYFNSMICILSPCMQLMLISQK